MKNFLIRERYVHVFSLDSRFAELSLDAPDPLSDLVVESDLAAGKPTSSAMASLRKIARGRDKEVRCGAWVEPVLVEPRAAAVNADIESGPSEESYGRKLVTA
jgi:hypothetical protein